MGALVSNLTQRPYTPLPADDVTVPDDVERDYDGRMSCGASCAQPLESSLRPCLQNVKRTATPKSMLNDGAKTLQRRSTENSSMNLIRKQGTSSTQSTEDDHSQEYSRSSHNM